MGSYLSEPVTEKISGDEQGDKMNCGHSSMQGWRVTQEVKQIYFLQAVLYVVEFWYIFGIMASREFG